MPKTNYYDIDAMKRRKKQRIKKIIKAIACIAVIAIIIALIISRQEVRELRQQNRDLTVMITAERSEIQEPARGSVSRIESNEVFIKK